MMTKTEINAELTNRLNESKHNLASVRVDLERGYDDNGPVWYEDVADYVWELKTEIEDCKRQLRQK